VYSKPRMVPASAAAVAYIQRHSIPSVRTVGGQLLVLDIDIVALAVPLPLC